MHKYLINNPLYILSGLYGFILKKIEEEYIEKRVYREKIRKEKERE